MLRPRSSISSILSWGRLEETPFLAFYMYGLAGFYFLGESEHEKRPLVAWKVLKTRIEWFLLWFSDDPHAISGSVCPGAARIGRMDIPNKSRS
jgi:hypothetical protein